MSDSIAKARQKTKEGHEESGRESKTVTMNITLLAAEIAILVDDLKKDSVINREQTLINLFRERGVQFSERSNPKSWCYWCESAGHETRECQVAPEFIRQNFWLVP